VDSVNYLFEKLIGLELNDGVTPVELAENIYSQDYTEIKIKKHFDITNCHVFYHDTEMFGERKIKFEQIYIYNKEFVLQEIQLKSKNNFQILWSRAFEESKLLNDIKQTLFENNRIQDFNLFLESLPEGLKNRANNFFTMSS
jgi:hypothetical protein